MSHVGYADSSQCNSALVGWMYHSLMASMPRFDCIAYSKDGIIGLTNIYCWYVLSPLIGVVHVIIVKYL